MKKYGIIALVLILVFALAACGRRNKEQDDTTPGTETNESTDTDPTIPDPTIMDPLPETNIPDPNVDTSMPETGTGEARR